MPRDAKGRILPGSNINPLGGGSPGWRWRSGNAKELARLIDEFTKKTPEELMKYLSRPETTVFEVIVGKAIEKAMQGDPVARETLLSRMVGKPKEIIEVANPKPIYIESPTKSLLIGLDYTNDIEAEVAKDESRSDTQSSTVGDSGGGEQP